VDLRLAIRRVDCRRGQNAGDTDHGSLANGRRVPALLRQLLERSSGPAENGSTTGCNDRVREDGEIRSLCLIRQASDANRIALSRQRLLRGTANSNSKSGRGDWIRTSDPLRPRQVRYQAALRPDSEDPRFYCDFQTPVRPGSLGGRIVGTASRSRSPVPNVRIRCPQPPLARRGPRLLPVACSPGKTRGTSWRVWPATGWITARPVR
jgi:hypothetical protein